MSNGIPVILETQKPGVLISGITKKYSKVIALNNLRLTVPEGGVYLFVGPNGSGKTTTMKILLDLVRPDEGTASVFGLNPQLQGSQVRTRIGFMPEQRSFGYPWLLTRRLLEHHATYYPTWDSVYSARLISALEVNPEVKYGKLSKGEARRVHFIMALAHRPPLLLLDEPMDGLDPVVRNLIMEILAEHLAENPTSMIVATHHVEELTTLAEYIGVIQQGRLVAECDCDLLRDRLRRYRFHLPEDTPDFPALANRIVHQKGTRGDVTWTIWGEEGGVLQSLEAAGVSVREASRLRLEEAVLALLTQEAIS